MNASSWRSAQGEMRLLNPTGCTYMHPTPRTPYLGLPKRLCAVGQAIMRGGRVYFFMSITGRFAELASNSRQVPTDSPFAGAPSHVQAQTARGQDEREPRLWIRPRQLLGGGALTGGGGPGSLASSR
jgi:hypothetical protein